jgi:hypothetical protein
MVPVMLVRLGVGGKCRPDQHPDRQPRDKQLALHKQILLRLSDAN